MTNDSDPDDITPDERPLLDDLRATLGSDSMPPGVVRRAQGLVAWFGVDEELTAVLQESTEELAGTRGTITTTSFVTPDGTVELELEVDEAVDGRRLVGQLIAGDVEAARLVDAAGAEVAAIEVDVIGRFEIVLNARGPHRLRLVDAAGHTVVTDWFVL